jgi:hypothetical protein
VVGGGRARGAVDGGTSVGPTWALMGRPFFSFSDLTSNYRNAK